MEQDFIDQTQVWEAEEVDFNAMVYSNELNMSELGGQHGGESTNYTYYHYYELGGPPQVPSYVLILETYVKPAIIVFGILSNVLMFLLILHTKLRKMAPMNYLAGIALADTGYLSTTMFPWFQEHFQIEIYGTVGMCQLVNYFLKVSEFVSFWYLTAFSLERLVWEFLPERRSDLCSVFKTKLVLLALAVISIYGHAYVCWFWEVSTDTGNLCGVHEDNIKTFQALLKIDMVFVCLLPYSLVIITAITVAVRKLQCRRGSTDTGRTTFGRNGRLQIVDNREDRARHMHATGIFLTLAVSMVLLTVPTNMVIFLALMLQVTPPLWTICLASLFHMYWSGKPVIYLIVSARTRHCAKQLVRHLISRAAKREESMPNPNNITLQEFSPRDCTDGTLIAAL